MKNNECVIEQYRGDKLVRTFTPSADPALPWSMNVNGKSYLRTSGWVLSKILPTLVEGSPFTTRVVPDEGSGHKPFIALRPSSVDSASAVSTSPPAPPSPQSAPESGE